MTSFFDEEPTSLNIASLPLKHTNLTATQSAKARQRRKTCEQQNCIE